MTFYEEKRKKNNLKKMSIFIIFVILLMSIFIYNIFPIIYGKLYSGNHIGIDISIYYDEIQISLDDVEIKCVNPDNKVEQVEKKDATYSVKGGKYGRYIFTITIPGTHIKEGEENIIVELQYLNSNDWYISDTDCIINIKSEASGQFSFGTTWGSSSSYTYNKTNVNLTQKSKNGDYASWKYDYKSKDEDVTWNAYLMSSSKVAGQVVYRLNSKPTYSNRAKNIPTKIYYDIRFGAGDSSTGEVANRLGPSTNRDMSIMTGTISLSY